MRLPGSTRRSDTNPLAGDYQTYVGNQYHAMEIFAFNAEAADILDPKKPTAQPAVAWVWTTA